MARNRKKRKKSSVLEYRRLPTEELYPRIEAGRARGDFRVAIEIAKECYRRDESPKHVELLGDLYVLRARELSGKDLHLEAFSVLNHALALGYGSQELLHLAFECGLRGGQVEPAMRMLGGVRDPDLRVRAALVLVDEVVVHPDRVSALCDPSIQEGASQIRRAFAAYERGDDGQAAAELKSIGLRNPCAGWKWLLLGLLAYGREDAANARSCWNRAGDDGLAGRMAGLLKSVLLDVRGRSDEVGRSIRTRLLQELGNPRVLVLEDIQQAIAEEDNSKALNLCRRLLSMVNTDHREAYAHRLSRAVSSALHWEPATGHQFRRTFGAFPEDRTLLRVTAIHLEREFPEEALEFWKAYLDELPRVGAIPPRLRARARGLIWRRMGDIARRLDEAEDSTFPFGGFAGPRDASSSEAVASYRTSIKHYPDDLEAQQKLLDALLQTEDRKRIEGQAEQILKRWPAHIDSLLLLGENCFDRLAFRKALSYFDRARQAEPFNTRINRKVRDCLLHSARRRLGQGSLDLARKDLEQAAALCPPKDPSAVGVYCQWAALEWRSGRADAAERVFALAEVAVEHTLVLYFCMVMELEAAQGPAPVRGRFDKLLKTEWKGRPDGGQAAAIVDVARHYDELTIRFDGSEALRPSLLRYLKGACKKAEFTEEQLLGVCRCLEATRSWDLLQRFACRGAKEFEADYFFPMFIGRAQLERGRWPLRDETIRLLGKAGLRASQAGEHKVAKDIAAILGGGMRPTAKSAYRLLQLIASAASEAGLADFDADPFDALDDSEEVPPRGKQSRSRDLQRGQMRLFDECEASEAENR